MKYRVVIELEFNGDTLPELIESDIKENFGPMIEDTNDRNPYSPLLKGSMVITREHSNDGR
jgi:hypothetical protein